MATYKLYVNIQENTHDYVTATVYNLLDEKVLKLTDIRKPDNVADYTTAWKNGLYPFYENMARTYLNDPQASFCHL